MHELSRRDYMALCSLQALIAQANPTNINSNLATFAVLMTDTLIATLDIPNTEGDPA